jgi:enoyl-CoA hydratase/carnithine racemase
MLSSKVGFVRFGQRKTWYRSISSTVIVKERVQVRDLGDGIKHVEFNRPEKINALDIQQFHAIAKVAKELREDRSIRAVILSGKGKGFCSGLDVKSVMKPSKGYVTPTSKIKDLLRRPSGYESQEDEGSSMNEYDPVAFGNLAQDVGYLWRQVQAPVISSIHGVCFGGGLQIALGCDFRYSTPGCKLSVMESKWGLIPDMSASVTLRELVRMDVAKELAFTGRIVDGNEALQLGLVTRVCENPLEEAVKTAKLISSRSPDSIAAAKILFQKTWIASEEDCLEMETKLQMKLLPSFNQIASSATNFGINIPFISRKDFEEEK